MAASASNGCEMCGFVRKSLLRRDIGGIGPVTIMCGYIWGANRGKFLTNTRRDDGLVYMRCEVFVNGKRRAYIVFPVEAVDESVGTWLRLDDSREKEPLGAENAEWIRDELLNCDNECAHGKELPNSTFLPTRLIDVGEEETGPKLVLSADLRQPSQDPEPAVVPYATLSYCWGPKTDADRQLKTVRSTLDDHCRSIPTAAMPAVVRDTVRVCRSLGIKYVWIDALCIVQDDTDDWDKESEMMGSVYYNAYLTICPLASHSCLQSFLEVRPPSLHIAFSSRRRQNTQGAFGLYESHNDEDLARVGERLDWSMDLDAPQFVDRKLSAWKTRGWTFQEECFSGRVLYFGNSMLHFTCASWAVSENSFVEEGPGSISPLRELIDKALLTSQDKAPDPRTSSIWEMINSIQGRQFTNPEDFFPSFSGLARSYASIRRDTYLAGLWKGTLPRDLLWMIPRPPVGNLRVHVDRLLRQDVYIAPTWSWASQPRYFENCANAWYEKPGTIAAPEEDPDVKMFADAWCHPSHLRQELTLISQEVSLKGINPYGRIRSASLLVHGKVAPLPSHVIMQPILEGRSPMGYFTGKRGTIMLDWSVSAKSTHEAEDMKLLLAASCCQPTSNRGLQWYANPEEDHAEDLRPYTDIEDSSLGIAEEGQDEAFTCSFCLDAHHKRNVWGVVVVPTGQDRAYFRVGVFVLFGRLGAMDVFRDANSQDLTLV